MKSGLVHLTNSNGSISSQVNLDFEVRFLEDIQEGYTTPMIASSKASSSSYAGMMGGNARLLKIYAQYLFLLLEATEECLYIERKFDMDLLPNKKCPITAQILMTGSRKSWVRMKQEVVGKEIASRETDSKRGELSKCIHEERHEGDVYSVFDNGASSLGSIYSESD